MEVVDKHKIVTGIYRAIEKILRMKTMKMGKLVIYVKRLKKNYQDSLSHDLMPSMQVCTERNLNFMVAEKP
jgi:hypothetical protein